jgi:hypothetical protein
VAIIKSVFRFSWANLRILELPETNCVAENPSFMKPIAVCSITEKPSFIHPTALCNEAEKFRFFKQTSV